MPRRSQNTGFTRVTTRAPSAKAGPEASSIDGQAVTVIEVSVSTSRSTKKAIFVPGRGLYSTTWPSTHKVDILST